MKKIVCKFGGSSLADAAHFRAVKEIILSNPSRKYIVASAPGKRDKNDTKVTDLLYACYDSAACGEDYTGSLSRIEARFSEIISELGITYDLSSEMQKIRAHLAGSPSRDYMASRGEYLNSGILAAYLGFSFVDPADHVKFSPERLLMEDLTNELLGNALKTTENAVIPGFYGSFEDGSICTFSRGGSDVSGSVVARAVGADIYENWTDVSGMLFTDPRIVDDPHTIECITYKELRELSYMGAAVLHEDAVFPVRKAGIPVNIRNTNRPADKGTMIVPEFPADRRIPTVTGVAGKKGFTSIQVEKSMMNAEVGFGAKLLSLLSSRGVPFEHCPTGIDTMSVVVHSAEFASREEEILEAIASELKPDSVILEKDLAMIAVVGIGMKSARGVAARICRAVADAGINIRMIDQGSSEINVIIGVEECDYEEAVRSICREFR